MAHHQVRELGERIARQFQQEQIILFGSYAYGTPDEHSNVDLLVRTPEELERRLAWNDFFLREFVEKGTVLYEQRLFAKGKSEQR